MTDFNANFAGKRIAVVNCVYPPEPVVSAQIGRDLATALADAGARVSVVCPTPSRPFGACYSSEELVAQRSHPGVEVATVDSFVAPQSKFASRMLESWDFGRRACQILENGIRPDVVYANTWPLISQSLIARYCNSRRIPLVLHFQDVYPEAIRSRLPKWSAEVLARRLTELDSWTARQAQRVIVISEGMRDVYTRSRRVSPERVAIVSNWTDERRFERPPSRIEACSKYGVRAAGFTFLYLGNIGHVAGVEFLIEAFAAAGIAGAQLVIAGSGDAKAACVSLVQRKQLKDVLFFPAPGEEVPTLQALGDVCLLPMRRGAGGSSIPSKLPTYLLSSKPVIATVDSVCDTAEYVRRAECGWIDEPENVEALAARMRQIADLNRGRLTEIGKRGREFALKHFSRRSQLDALVHAISSAHAPDQCICI